MNMRVLVLFLGIIMISSTYSISSSDALLPLNIPNQSQAPEHVQIIEGENLIAYARALYTSLDNPSNHLVPTSDPHNGVAKLRLVTTDGTFGCSGTLASDRLHIITAAHCVADNNGNFILTSGSATFEGEFESVTLDLDAANSVSHPNYDGDYIKGNDIAILKLFTTAPTQIPGIPHATSGSASAVDTVVDKNGYGYSGLFSSGTDSSTYPFGDERNGQNKYDAFADTMYVKLGLTSGDDFNPKAIYQYDSDDGSSSHDAFGFFFGIYDTGFNNEVLSAPGDSGGPTILNGELVGVTSYGITLEFSRGPPPRTSDCTTEGKSPLLDSSCGEFAGDTRVSYYAEWIATVLSPVNDGKSPIISSINVDTSSTTATITWTTDEPATSLVNYGADYTYGSSVSDTSHVTSHSIELTGLSSLTNYHFMVTSEDASNNSASSSDDQFMTTSPPTLESISISPDNPSITEGSTQQFTVTGTYSDGPDQVLTVVTWSSSDGNVATINADGLASGILDGSTTIKAISGGLEDITSLVVIAASEDPTTVRVLSVTYGGEGGKNGDKHLLIMIALVDDLGDPVSGASVSIDLFRNNIFVGSGTGTTSSTGIANFSYKNASVGCYTTTVTNVDASDLDWILTDTPVNKECKEQTNNAKNSTPSVIKSKN